MRRPSNHASEAAATRARLARVGVQILDEAWASLPAAARRRLARHPVESERDRQALRDLVAWLEQTFPPGWNAAAE